MRIPIACYDQELLWVVDDVLGGLYSVNLDSFEMKCEIDCWKLFPYGKYEVLSLFIWKEKYLVLVPLETDKNWIFYNKVTGEIESRQIIKRKCQEIMITADQKRNQLYFFPLYGYDPILIIDLNTLSCIQMIENWSEKKLGNHCETSWKGICNSRYVFFPIKNTRLLVRMDCDSHKVELLEIDIAINLIDISYGFGELWVLPISGNKIYQIDENGLIVNIVELLVENTVDSLPNYARIIAQKRYLFLLPYYQKGIYAYDKLTAKTHIIPRENTTLEKTEKQIHLRYWEYYIRNNQICFLPYCDNYIEIDLSTLAYRKKKFSNLHMWSYKERIQRCIWSHISKKDSLIRETDECKIDIFMEYIQYKTYMTNFSESKIIGEKIWNMVKI